MTDTRRVARLFENAGSRWVNLMEIVTGLNIIEYSGRISDLRKEWGCTCGKDPNFCTADKHIVNVKKGWYQFKQKHTTEVIMPPQPVNKVEVEQKLKALRREYLATENEMDRKVIEMRANALKKSLITIPQESNNLYQAVKENLL